MKAFEIFVTRLAEDYGYEVEDERIAVVTTEEKVAEKIADYRAKREKNQFWMGLATEKVNGERKIRFKVKEIEVE